MTRLLCDEMLHGLARWLRAAGHDTAIAAAGRPDREIVAGCAAEGRILVTRDRQLATMAEGAVRVVHLGGQGLDAQAHELQRTLGLDWLHAPFTVCVMDNTRLEPASAEVAMQVPPRARAVGGPLRFCPECRRLYWPGSHVRRMQARLAAWARSV